jgi:DNA-binding transcriptional MerR regulator
MDSDKIPSKLFFKIGEVWELTDTQPYVLRYWESEFPALSPGKNNSGQRIYRRRDIDTILRIKALLYEEGFTIAGAKKRLEQEMKDQLKANAGTATDEMTEPTGEGLGGKGAFRDQIQSIRSELSGLLDLLDKNDSKRKRK